MIEQKNHLGDGHDGPDQREGGQERGDVPQGSWGNQEGFAALAEESQDPDHYSGYGSCGRESK